MESRLINGRARGGHQAAAFAVLVLWNSVSEADLRDLVRSPLTDAVTWSRMVAHGAAFALPPCFFALGVDRRHLVSARTHARNVMVR